MQLCYRGNTYCRSNQRFNQVDLSVTAKFRGNSYTIHRSNSHVSDEPAWYQYRGIAYLKSTAQLEK